MASKLIQEQLLDSLRDTFGSNPTNVDLANRYWNALASLDGHNVRSGGFVIEVYRQAALTSKDGVIALDKPTAETYVEELTEIVVNEYRRARQRDRAVDGQTPQ